MSIRDFQTRQIRASKLIASRSDSGQPSLLIYSASNTGGSFAGGLANDVLTNVGSDVFIFISGSKTDPTGLSGVRSGPRDNVTLFGGDVVVSGTLFAEHSVIEVDGNITGSMFVSGALFVSRSLNAYGTSHSIGPGGVRHPAQNVTASIKAGQNKDVLLQFIEVQNYAGADTHFEDSNVWGFRFRYDGTDNEFFLESTNPSNPQIPKLRIDRDDPKFYIGSGANSSAASPDEWGYTDTSFFVSGAVGSRGTSTKGTAVFGGDLVASGNLLVSGTSLFESGLEVAGDISVDEKVIHRGDTNTYIKFTPDTISLVAKDNTFLTGGMDPAGTTCDISIGDIDNAGSGPIFTIDGDTGTFRFTHYDGEESGPGLELVTNKHTRHYFGTGSGAISAAGDDVNFYVSGTVSSRGTSTAGTAVFLGDTVISGGLVVGNSTYPFTSNPTILMDGTAGYSRIATKDNTDTYIQFNDSDVAGNGKHAGEISFANDGVATAYFTRGYAHFNPANQPKDFRIDGDTRDNVFVVSASKDQVLILSGGGATSYDESSGNDVAFYVSGAINSRGTSDRGTTVFGGDTATSGSIYAIGGGTDKGFIRLYNNVHFPTVELSGSSSQMPRVNFSIAGGTAAEESAQATIMYTSSSSGGGLWNFLNDGGSSQYSIVDRDRWQSPTRLKNVLIYSASTVSEGQSSILFLSSSSASGATSPDPGTFQDTNFWVSGSIGNKNSTSHRGTAVFGGDVHISGNLTTEGSSPSGGGGSGASVVGWATGSAGFLPGGGMGPAGHISTTGSLSVTGTLRVVSGIHVNNNASTSVSKFGVNGQYPFVTIGDNAEGKVTIGPHEATDTTSILSIWGNDNNPGPGIDIRQFGAGGFSSKGPDILLYKGRGSYGAAQAAAQDGDRVANFFFVGYDTATTTETGAKIEVEISGTVGEEQMPMEMRFLTRGPASTDVAEQKLIIKPHRQILILSGGASGSADEASGVDVAFYVSGAIGSRVTANRGASLFGGDLIVSGGLYVSGSTSEAAPVYIGASGDDGTTNPMIELRSDKISASSTDRAIQFSANKGVIHTDAGYDLVTAQSTGGVSTYVGGRGYDIQVAGTVTTNPSFYVAVDASTNAQSIWLTSDDGGIRLTAGGANSYGKVLIEADTATDADSIELKSAAGGILLDLNASSGKKFHVDVESTDTDSIHLDTAGGIDLDAVGSVFISGSQVLILSGANSGATSANEATFTDTNFFVSGSINSKNSGRKGTALFGGDVVISGNLYGGDELVIGSDVHMYASNGSTQYLNFGASDGTSGYGVRSNAGTMEFKSSGGAWAAMGSGGGGGGGDGITVLSGSVSTGSVTTLNLDLLGSVMDLGGGTAAITGTIGASNMGTYEAGLFSSFDTTTPIGFAINKINEVLKYLSPNPAPDLDDLGTGNKGINAKLAIGSSPGMTAVSALGDLSAVADNSLYQITTGSSNIRQGIFNATTTFEGDLNSDVHENSYANGIINYSGSTFGNANYGTLRLTVNGTVVQSVDLTDSSVGSGNPGAGTGTQVDAHGSGFVYLSQTGSAYQANGEAFGLFQNRTGKFRVASGTQHNGWNYAVVTHQVGATTTTTNYVEWLVDPSGSHNIAVANARVPTDETGITLGGSFYESGILYATGARGDYNADIQNYYDHVFTNETISFGTTNCAIDSQTVPNTDGSGNSYLNIIPVTGTFETDTSMTPGDTIGVNLSVAHIFKSNVTSAGGVTSSPFLIYSTSFDGTGTYEGFNLEFLRVNSGAYNAMSDVPSDPFSAHPNKWDVTASLVDAGSSHKGLQFFEGKLKSPKNTLTALTTPGDFRSVNNGGGNFGDGYSYDGNPNYSTVASTDVLHLFRPFMNSTATTVRDFSVAIRGSSTTIVPLGTSLDSGKIRVHAKIPGKTGFLDLGTAFSYNTASDGSGGRIGSLDPTVDASGATNYFSFGTGSIEAGDRVVLKVEARGDWAGDLNDITVTFPAVGVTAVPEAPNVDDLACSNTGQNGKLSFGASNALGGYTSVAGGLPAGTLSNVDWNGSYQVNSVGAGVDERRGIFNGSTDIGGIVNDSTTANGNAYSANSFGNAITGTLVLECNGANMVSVPLHDFGLGNGGDVNRVNADGSGFVNISQATVGQNGSSLPDYRRWYRTANWIVDSSNQRNGWNYARVVHSGANDDGGALVTNYVEWVNDSDGTAMAIDTAGFAATFADDEYYLQSGVKYFANAPTSSFSYRVTSGYTNVYSDSSSALYLDNLSNLSVTRMEVSGTTVTDAGANAAAIGFPALNTVGGQNSPVHVTASIVFTQAKSLPGSAGSGAYGVTGSAHAIHPLDGTKNSSTLSKPPLLVFSASLTNTSAQTSNANTQEVFAQEYYRLMSGSFANQSATGSAHWDSSKSLESGGVGYNTGLLTYNYAIYSPKFSGIPAGGDFRNLSEGGTYTTPKDNPNYTSLSNSERDYYRAFLNNTTSDQADVSITLYGDATLVPRSGAGAGTPGANKNFFLDVKIPGKTGWMDSAKAASGGISDGDGALSGDRDSTVDGAGATNTADFQTAFIAGTASSGGPEHFIIRIVAHENWTGHIDRIVVSYV